jgi:signal transduction histidine kinase
MLDQKLVPPGSSAWSELRAQAANAVIVTTGRDLAAPLVLRALRNGAYDHFDKVTGAGELAIILARCLGEERRRLTQATYEQLRLAKEAAESANRAKSEFLATMGHELRTPLNAVIGFSEIIMDAVMGPVDGRYREYARDIHKSGQHLLGLIGDVLDLSKVEAGRLELHEGAVDVGRVIAACRRLVIERARANGVAIEEAVAPDLPPLMADELRLKQIVLNLVSNAVKFTPAGGRVSVAASVAEGGMTITVADTGIGMRTEDIPAALEPFRQVDDALNRRFQGTGLGLPLAKMLTELHGGTLEIASEPGRGTTVRVRLPESRVVRKAA